MRGIETNIRLYFKRGVPLRLTPYGRTVMPLVIQKVIDDFELDSHEIEILKHYQRLLAENVETDPTLSKWERIGRHMILAKVQIYLYENSEWLYTEPDG